MPDIQKSFVWSALAVALIWISGCAVGSKTIVSPAHGTEIEREIVVLLHGLGRSNRAMWRLAERLEDDGFRVARVGYDSLRETPDEILDDIAAQIEACCIGKSAKLHFVGHSLGGLLVRAYLADKKIENLGGVVLIGTPNKGTEVVNNLREKWWFKWAGPTAKALSTDSDSFPNRIERPDYPLGVIAGIKPGADNEHILPGEDDGLVAVESTKVKGMTDFVLIEAGHSALRNDKNVARQTVAFLRAGKFFEIE